MVTARPKSSAFAIASRMAWTAAGWPSPLPASRVAVVTDDAAAQGYGSELASGPSRASSRSQASNMAIIAAVIQAWLKGE